MPTSGYQQRQQIWSCVLQTKIKNTAVCLRLLFWLVPTKGMAVSPRHGRCMTWYLGALDLGGMACVKMLGCETALVCYNSLVRVRVCWFALAHAGLVKYVAVGPQGC